MSRRLRPRSTIFPRSKATAGNGLETVSRTFTRLKNERLIAMPNATTVVPLDLDALSSLPRGFATRPDKASPATLDAREGGCRWRSEATGFFTRGNMKQARG
jgi:hypothetical protein